MRNLKKILALVLALMMVLSVMVFASAKGLEDYEDAAEVSDEYAEAVDVLTSLGIYEGDEGGFRPQDNITRAEVTALVYRVLTGDVAAENQAHIWAGSATDEFNDLPSTVSWAYGYIGYATHYGYVVGSAEGVFDPNGNITGYQLLAIMLRAIGYDQNGEFEGDQWAANVAKVATERGILDGFDVSLSSELTREEVAYLIFNAIRVAQVTYTPALGYNMYKDMVPSSSSDLNDTLGFREFGLVSESARGRSIWGQPGDQWYYNASADSVTATTKTELVFRTDTPVATYYTAVTECDVADDLGNTLKSSYATYTNGLENKASVNETINPLNRVSTIGEQGRRTEIYANKATEGTIVYIDTFLAKVTAVSARTYDEASHVWKPAELTVTIYSNKDANPYYGNGVTMTQYSTIADYPYSVGDMLAVNKITSNYNNQLGTGNYYIQGVLTASVVTVNAITKDAAGNLAGFVGTNGTRYLYNHTFTKDATGTDKLDTKAIGSSYYVWTDAQGNVMAVLPVPSGSTGYGVVTGYDVERVSSGKYAIVLDVLQSNNTTTQVKLNNNGTFYSTLENAESTAKNVFGNGDRLISYSQGADGYCGWLPATADTINSSNGGVVMAGEADALTTNTVNDNTVFFVAKYTYSNGDAEYQLTGYDVVTGFKNIQDLGIDTTVDATFVDGSVTVEKTAVEVTVLADQNAVLVKYANKQSVPATQNVENYAFLITEGQHVDVSDDFHVYNAILNGVSGQNLKVTAAASANVTSKGTGLYSYSDQTTNGWDTVVKESGNEAAQGSWSAPVAGVMTLNSDTSVTVADDCVFYLVNTTTGYCNSITASELAEYAAECRVAVQYDNYGYVDLIYVFDADLT